MKTFYRKCQVKRKEFYSIKSRIDLILGLIRDDWKCIIINDGDLHQYNLNGDFIYSTIDLFEQTIEKYPSCDIILAGTEDQLYQIKHLISKYENIKTIYTRTESKEMCCLIELFRNGLELIEIDLSERQLMRHLYLRAMLCYFHQGRRHKNENRGLANRCFIDAKTALEKAHQLLV